MKNSLKDAANQLAHIDYTKLLKAMNDEVEELQIEREGNALTLTNIDLISRRIADRVVEKHKDLYEFFQIEKDRSPYYLSIHHKDYVAFAKAVGELKKSLEEKAAIAKENVILTKLESVKQEVGHQEMNFGIAYPFKEQHLLRQKVCFKEANSLQAERLRVDEVEIKIDLKEIKAQFIHNLCSSVKEECIDESLQEEKIAGIKQGKYGTEEMTQLLNCQSLGRIKRTISYLYLDYLLQNVREETFRKTLLEDYVRRFKMVEIFLSQLAEKPEEEARISINGYTYNLCNILCNENAFENLPFIGKVEGTLLEERQAESKSFQIALKMKLNGTVNEASEEKENIKASTYWLKLIGSSEQSTYSAHMKRLMAFFNYTFMLVKLGNRQYDPIVQWGIIKKKIDEKGFDFVASRLTKEENIVQIENDLQNLKDILEEAIYAKASHLKVQQGVYTRNLILYKGILADDLSGEILFKPVTQYQTEYLKYIAIVKNKVPSKDTLLNIPMTFMIRSKSLYESSQEETTTLNYQLENLKVLPVVMYPAAEDCLTRERDGQRMRPYLEKITASFYIKIPYSTEKLEEDYRFVYHLIYMSLTYIILNEILKQLPLQEKKALYISILRMHKQRQDEAVGREVRDFSKVLEHLLNIDYRASSQGFVVDRPSGEQRYTYLNAAASLYVKVPKVFAEGKRFEADKVALLTVTSRKTDAAWRKKGSRHLLLGEVTLFQQKEDGQVLCDIYESFADYYEEDEMYQNPTILNDVINRLYYMSYKKILYIAKAPYSSTLNITSTIENMYFMNEEIIESMKSHKEDLMIYPLYYTHYFAIDYLQKDTEALYVRDTREMENNLTHNSRSIGSVLNLFSGKAVGSKRAGRHYRSVMLYSTLCNMYQDKQTNAQLFQGLVSNSQLKEELVEMIIFYHYAKYESSSRHNIKMNPYAHLMESEGVGARSVEKFYLGAGSIFFNTLAYLADIKKVIDKE